MASRISSGPVEQLSPMMSTPSELRMVTTAPACVPRSIVPLVSSRLTDACSGSGDAGARERLARAEDRRLHLEDVLRRLDDEEVAPAFDEALRLLGERLGQLPQR